MKFLFSLIIFQLLWREDLAARGLDGRCDAAVQVVDVDGFVLLTEEADKTVSWS